MFVNFVDAALLRKAHVHAPYLVEESVWIEGPRSWSSKSTEEVMTTLVNSPRIKSLLPAMLAGLILSLVYLQYFAFKAEITIDIKVMSQGRALLQVFWAENDAEFSENNSRQVLLRQGKTHYKLFVGGLGGVDKLRIDPGFRSKQFFLGGIEVRQTGYKPIVLNPDNGFEGLNPLRDIDQLKLADTGLTFKTTGEDSQFLLDLSQLKQGGFSLLHLANVLLIFFATAVFARTCGGLQQDLKFVPILMLIATALILTMAMVSNGFDQDSKVHARLYVHPDEKVHVDAINYYRHHLLPPPIDAEVVANTFSIYGKTRLATLEPYYPVAGYLSRLLLPLKNSLSTDSRLITVSLFVFLGLMTMAIPAFRPIAVPLLVSPQIWYLFSYANSDAFALFLSSIVAFQAVYAGSAFNRVLTEKKPKWLWLHIVWIGLLAGALLLSKQNFYIFLLFIGLFVLWRLVNGEFSDSKLLWKRLAMLGVIAGILVASRVALDYSLNGPDPAAKVQQMAEIKAVKRFKPSTPLSGKDTSMYLKQRGVTLDRIMLRDKWAGKTFYNSFGSYGFTQFFATQVYFNLIKVVGILLLCGILFSLLVRAPPRTHGLFLITLICTLLVLAASLWVSWSEAFQPQGRYLAPILPMLGVLYYCVRPYLFHRTVNALLIAMFALSMYSFIFVGLSEIPKVS